MTSPLRLATAVTAAVTLSITLVACGGGSDDGPAAGAGGSGAAVPPTAAAEVEGPHNDADITFAQDMLPHHRQAVEMAELAPDRAEDPEVVAVAEEIAAAQEPEIATMTGFLEAWGAEVPAEDMSMEGMDGMAGMDGAAGMMSPEDMTALGSAEGAEFDELFLQMMVEHHEGAVDMARAELDEGENPAAQDLAQRIVDTQESEIERMQDLLGS